MLRHFSNPQVILLFILHFTTLLLSLKEKTVRKLNATEFFLHRNPVVFCYLSVIVYRVRKSACLGAVSFEGDKGSPHSESFHSTG